MRIYLAGPMRNLPLFNFPAFDAAAAALRALGLAVFSPAEHDRATGFDETAGTLDGFDLARAVEWDLQTIIATDAVAFLPGWNRSDGSLLELQVAQAIGRRVFTIGDDFALHPFDADVAVKYYFALGAA